VESTLRVRSSDGSHSYLITFGQESGRLRMRCSCPAGELGKLCRHKAALLDGDDSVLLAAAEDRAPFDTLQNLLPSSQIPQLLRNISDLDATLVDIKRKLTRAKRELEVTLRGA
jgi:uncharacterized Zn finger protein